MYPTLKPPPTPIQKSDPGLNFPAIKALAGPKHIPLSFSQERLWFIDRLQGSVQYHLPVVLRLTGIPDKAALSNALQQVVQRHEVLRTVIREKEGTGYQHIQTASDWQLQIVDGSTYKDDRERLQQFIRNSTGMSFDLSADYMLRATLISLADEDHILVATLHQIAADEWSASLLITELADIYNAYVAQHTISLPSLPLQYADYAIWQHSCLNGEAWNRKLKYWKNKLQGTIALQLPADYPRPSIQSTNGAIICADINKVLSDQLYELSRQQDVTLFMTLLTAFNVLLYRYTGQQDICVGTPVAGRPQPELDRLIGSFVNTLALRSEVDGGASFADLLHQVKRATLEAYEHQEIPFEKVVEAVVKERDMSRSPLFQVMLVLQNRPEVQDLRLGQLQLSYGMAGLSAQINAKFDLTLIVTETGQGLAVTIEYCRDLYGEQTIQRMATHFTELLHSIVQAPKQIIDTLSMLSIAGEQQLLVGFNDTAVDYPKDKSIIVLFEEQVAEMPERIAVIFEKDQLSYGELNSRANRLANYLRSKGVKEETIVPICVERSLEMIVTILGVLKAGAAYVPIDPEYPIDRIGYMLEDIAASIVVSSKRSRVKINNTNAATIIEVDGDWPVISGQPSGNLSVSVHPRHLAYIIYTSGSTGKPKGVMIEHTSVVNLLMSIADSVQFGSNSTFLSVTTYSFDISYLELFMPLLFGGELIIVPKEVAMDGFKITEQIKIHRPTHMQGTPASWQLLIEAGWENKEGLTMLIGGEAVKESIKQMLTKRGDVYNCYGPTETTIWSATKKLAVREKVVIGKPIWNTKIVIVNRNAQLCPVGVAGEICIGGAGLARGYFNRPELTAEKFIKDPFTKEAGERLYRTGDTGYWLPDGNIECLGRIDDQVKIRGYRIELGEIESALQQSGLVQQSVVVAKEGKDTKLLIGFYVPDWKVIKAKETALYQEQVAAWKEIYETEYRQPAEDRQDAEFDIGIWTDSFTGKPIGAVQMKEWLAEIVEVILAEDTGSVLEIGCGTGLIYYQLAGKVKKYIGTDFSAASVSQIRHQISKDLRNYGPTELQVCAAHEIILSEDEHVDTVILNSVVQYFPGEAYMNEVIGHSIGHLKGRGRIIIGDVRDKRLLEVFKGRLQLQKLPGSVSIREFNWSVDGEVLKEEELCFSPDYFYALKSLYPRITHVQVEWKQGSHINELTLYRYNVVIYVGIENEAINPEWQLWKNSNKQNIISQLHKGHPVIAIKNVPNPRLWQERQLSRTLEANLVNTVSELSEAIAHQDNDSREIRAFWEAATAKGYHYRLLLNEDPLLVNIFLELAPSRSFISNNDIDNKKQFQGSFTNVPLFGNIVSLLQKEIRMVLGKKLPEFMVPSDFIAVSRLPLTANGKVDRLFLSRREDKGTIRKLGYQPAHTEMEQKLCVIWQDLLGIEQVGINDNFFELGGHSLLGMRLISAIRKELNVELAIIDLFSYATIGSLAGHIELQATSELLPAIRVKERPQYVPLSFSQERLWFIDRLQGSMQYHIPAVLRLKGKLDIEALSNALRQIVHRHEVLRTVIQEEEGAGYQQIIAADGWQLTLTDGSVYKEDPEGLRQLITNSTGAPFDLSADYMLRAALIRLDEEDHILAVTFHHIAYDGWSESVMFSELAEFYNSHVEGRQARLPELPVQYADYAIWQRTYLQGEAWDKKLNYWKEKLEGTAPLQLPADFSRPPVQSTHGATTSIKINKTLSDQLHALSQQQGTTLFMTLLAAFKVLLYRYSGQQDICVGTPTAGRQQHELEGLIGFFVNTLALRSELNGTTSFTDLLQQVKATMLEAYSHQEIPFEKVVEVVVKKRDLSWSPLFQVMFVLQNTPDVEQLQLGQVQMSAGIEDSATHNTAKFDLTFTIAEKGQGLVLTVEYRTDLYREPTVNRMMAHFSALLHSVVKAPQQSIATLPMLSTAEKEQLLIGFNDTKQDNQAGKTIVELFEEQVAKTPEATAVVFEKQQFSYQQLNAKANQLAHHLKKKGVKEEALVPLCLERSTEMFITILAILKAGGAYVPIDPQYPAERIAYMLDDMNAGLVICNAKTVNNLSVAGNHSTLDIDHERSLIHAQPLTNPGVVIEPHHLAYIIYTSGSTGRPKGVMIQHRALGNYLLNNKTRYVNSHTANAGSFIHLSYTFDASLTAMFMPLLCGKSIVISSSHSIDMFDDANFHQYAPYDFIKLTPSHLDLLGPVFKKGDGKSVTQKLVIGGEALRRSHFASFIENDLEVEVVNEYGPTEATVGCSTYTFRIPADSERIQNGVSIGKPIDNTFLYILGNQQQLVPVGVAGELYIGGIQVARGYLNLPELTAERFITNPFIEVAGARMYKTGDLARWLPDGNIEYLGRTDDQVKIRGYRIELGEIENMLQQSEGVSQAVVLAKEDNNGDKTLVAYVVPAGAFKRQPLIAYLKAKLPDYMVPATWVALEQLPINRNGKVDKKALPEPDNATLSARRYEAPRNELETKLAAIWQELLPVKRIGIHDNFFNLGGHSLYAIRLVWLIRKKMDVSVSVNEIFIHPTVAGLASNIVNKATNPSLPDVNIKYLVPIKTTGYKPPLYLIAGGGGTALKIKKFADLLHAEQPVYVFQPPIGDEDLRKFPGTIEGIATVFIEEMLIQNPDGPYALSGHCIGGIIAFEMAKQLQARNKKVHSLAIFDTILEKENKEPGTFKNLFHLPSAVQQSLSRLLLKISFQIYLLRKHPRQSILYKVDTFRTMRNRIKRKNFKTDYLEYAGLEIFDDSIELYNTACKNYILHPYDGQIILFYATDRYFFLDRDNNIGFKKMHLDESTKNSWKAYAAGISVHEIKGEHSDIFDPTHGGEFARTLQQHLDRP